MEVKKPTDIPSYKKWLSQRHGVEVTAKAKTYYQAVTTKAAGDFAKSSFWQGLQSALPDINRGYYLQTNYYLLTEPPSPQLQIKPYDSFILKTFRHNILNNRNWPAPPEKSWLLPDNWFAEINDTIRTYFVVKYLDGVNFLADYLAKQACEATYESQVDFEAKEEGYYAAHFYVKFPCEIPCENWDTRDELISIEIQITTQLQEVIRRLLHKYYEQRRTLQPIVGEKWQWNYRSDEFAANYLGHILHYVEGMIMDVRDKRIGKETKDEE
ncbi:MAG: hypothetical protein AB7Y74_11755 [Syntrophorhabdus sp.]